MTLTTQSTHIVVATTPLHHNAYSTHGPGHPTRGREMVVSGVTGPKAESRRLWIRAKARDHLVPRQRYAAEPRGFSSLARFPLLVRFSCFPTHWIGFYLFLSTRGGLYFPTSPTHCILAH